MLRQAFETAVGNFPQYYVGLSYSAGSLSQYCTGIFTAPEVCRSIAPVFSQYRKSFHKKTRMHLLSGAVGSPFIQ
jgi:hypothetical protein